MKNIKYLIVVIVLLAVALGCQKEKIDANSANGLNSPILEIGTDGYLIQNFGPDATIRAGIVINTNVEEWGVTSDQEWCSVSIIKDNEINSLMISVTANDNLDVRSAKVTVTASGTDPLVIEVNQLGAKPAILFNVEKPFASCLGETLNIIITTNVTIESEQVATAPWLRSLGEVTRGDIYNSNYKIEVDAFVELGKRSAEVIFKGVSRTGENVESSLLVTQQQITGNYTPEISGEVKQLQFVSALTVPANLHQPDQPTEGPIEFAIDGDYGTMYHTLWGETTTIPQSLIFTFAPNTDTLSYILLYPRGSSSNGIIKKAEIWITTFDNPTPIKMVDVDMPLSNGAVKVRMPITVASPKTLTVKVLESYGNGGVYVDDMFVSLAEIEAYQEVGDGMTLNENEIISDQQYFTDASCSELKPEVTLANLSDFKSAFMRQMAQYMLNDAYPREYRIADYEAYMSPADIATRMNLGQGYSMLDNVTGMFLEKGEHLIFVGPTNGKSIKMVLPEWMRGAPSAEGQNDWSLHKQTIPLKTGLNLVNVGIGTLAYIEYFDEGAETRAVPKIRVHFPTGTVNGYFDPITKGHTNEDFKRLIDSSIAKRIDILDARGKHIQVAFRAKDYKKNCYNEGVELLDKYDEMVGQQQVLMGISPTGIGANKSPKNRVLSRINFHYYMFRDGDGMAYVDWAVERVCSPAQVVNGDNCWGFNHEMGHVHQMHQMKWGGVGEVSNNIFAQAVYTAQGNQSLLITNNVYAKANQYIFDKDFNEKQIPFAYYGNADDAGSTDLPNVGEPKDYVVRLVPFWKLYLYSKEVGLDLFPIISKKLRESSPLWYGGNDGYKDMFRFCILVSDALKLNLYDYFEKWGFLVSGTVGPIDDYGRYTYNITDAEVEEVKTHMSQYPDAPKRLFDIEDNN